MNTLLMTREKPFTRDVIIVLLAGLFITLMGQFSIPLPFTPIPIAFRLQTILLLSILLGSRRASLAVGVFMALQAPLLLGPTAGYIVGYLLAATLVKPEKPLYSFVVGTLVVYACGFMYLSTLIGVQKALLLGIVPFVLGDIIKTMICFKILNYVRRA